MSCSSVTYIMQSKNAADRTIANNKTGIIISYNETRTCMLTDVAISENRNVIKKEAEMFL
jgi:hypothetical protein